MRAFGEGDDVKLPVGANPLLGGGVHPFMDTNLLDTKFARIGDEPFVEVGGAGLAGYLEELALAVGLHVEGDGTGRAGTACRRPYLGVR